MNSGSDSERLAVIEATVNRIDLNLFGPDGQGGIFATIDRRLNRTDLRVSKLENWRWWVLGIAVGLGIAFGGITREIVVAVLK